MSEMLKLFNQFGSDKSQQHLYHLVSSAYPEVQNMLFFVKTMTMFCQFLKKIESSG